MLENQKELKLKLNAMENVIRQTLSRQHAKTISNELSHTSEPPILP